MLTLRNALVLSCVCLSGLPARAQDASIIVTEQKIQKLNEKEFLIVTLKNMSQKSIIGFIVRLNLIDGKGLPFDSVVMGGVSYDPNIDRKKPGESWTLMVDPTSD